MRVIDKQSQKAQADNDCPQMLKDAEQGGGKGKMVSIG